MQSDSHILAAIVTRAVQGDTKALSWLYDSYVKAMYNICYRMMGDKLKAEDVLHDAFITAFSKLQQLNDGKQFGSWLKRIVINKCITALKSGFKWVDVTAGEIQLADEEEDDLFNKLTVEIINNEIKKLPEGCRQVFSLYIFEQLSHKEIAEAMNITESTSKSQYHRARQLLKTRLKILANG